MKRTHLPLNGLRVFDAAARHLSFTRAADELAVTPAAVGQQIRALEDMLGVVLFRRTARGLELTPEGEGVVGEQPLIEPGASFDYVSGCPLATPTGAMQGSYRMVDDTGAVFDVAIPNFSLSAPAVTS